MHSNSAVQYEYVIDTIWCKICEDIAQTSGKCAPSGSAEQIVYYKSVTEIGSAAITYFLCSKQAILSATALLSFP